VKAPTKRMKSDLLWVTRWLTTIVVIEFWDCIVCAFVLNIVPSWSCHFAWTIVQWPAVEHILNQFRFNKPCWRPHDAFELIAFYALVCVGANLAGIVGFARVAQEWARNDYADPEAFCAGRGGGSGRRLQIYRGAMVDYWVAHTQETCDECMVREGSCCGFFDACDADANATACAEWASCEARCWTAGTYVDGNIMFSTRNWRACAMMERSLSMHYDHLYLGINNLIFALLYLRIVVAALRLARDFHRHGIEHIVTESTQQEEKGAHNSSEEPGYEIVQHQPSDSDAQGEVGDFQGKIAAERTTSKSWFCLSCLGFGMWTRTALGPDRMRQRGWICLFFAAWLPFEEDKVRIGSTNRFRKADDPNDVGFCFLSGNCALSLVHVEAALC